MLSSYTSSFRNINCHHVTFFGFHTVFGRQGLLQMRGRLPVPQLSHYAAGRKINKIENADVLIEIVYGLLATIPVSG